MDENVHNTRNVRIVKERKFWDKISRNYDKQTAINDGELYNELIGLIKKSVKKEDVVLDVACGTGKISLEIAPIVRRVFGVDVSPKMIDIAVKKAGKEGFDNVEYCVADGYNIPYNYKSFDIVLCCNVLHVVRDPDAMLQEANRLLKYGGILITSTDCYSLTRSLSAKIRTVMLRAAHAVGLIPYLHFYKPEKLIELTKQQGFDIVDQRIIDYIGMSGIYLKSKKMGS